MNKYKQGEYMTNLKKLGLTALAGSLAAVSAHAGEMSVSGGAIVSYTTGDSGANSANSLGHKTDITFSGSGELDNGYTVDTFVFLKDDFSVISSSALTLTMGSMGTVGVSKGGGFNVNGAYDETYPRAYEENSDAGAQSSSNYVGNWADDNAIIYKAPSIDILGATVSVGAEYALQADGSATTADGAGIARDDTYDTGYGVGATVAYEGLTLGAYAAERENRNFAASAQVKDEFNGSWFVNYSFGPVAIGYQETYVDAGLAEGTNDNTTTAAKTVGTSGGIFDSQAMSIAFNVNENVSISYSEVEDTYDSQDGLNTTADVKQDSDSFQIAYSMGAMSVKAYTTEIKNPNYDADAAALNVNEIAIGLAF